MFFWKDEQEKDSTKPAPECQCGCGASTKGGRFLPGHDAKLKKALIESALGGAKRAISKLETLGWTKFLEAKQQKPANAKKTVEPAPSTEKADAPQPVGRRGRRPRKTSAPDASEQPAGGGAPEGQPAESPLEAPTE